ncbi:unnamed protein product [Protopolystoma xenopodis]|uniref:Uncharacterized protein n=1 Tax=Protopolystoma xenopodis TaxID=117903 RepID=A0A3S5BFL9_9PLAT|nr:unnamed protein product [Protopolystoma xenopodis]
MIVLGARRDTLPRSTTALPIDTILPIASSLGHTCFRDLRLNQVWLPITSTDITSLGSESPVTSVTTGTRASTPCSDLALCPSTATCPTGLVCLPTWKPATPHCG